MASVSSIGPRGLSGMIEEKASLFQDEYRAIQDSVRAVANTILLRRWSPSSSELAGPDVVLRGKIQEYSKNYLLYEETVVARAHKLFQAMQSGLDLCNTRPHFMDGNWEYLSIEGVDVEPIKDNIKLMKSVTIPRLQQLTDAAEKLYLDLFNRLQVFGGELNSDFALAYNAMETRQESWFWSLFGVVKKQLQAVLPGNLQFLERGLSSARSREMQHHLATSPIAPPQRSPSRAEHLNQENENLTRVSLRLQQIAESFGLTKDYTV